MNDIKKDSAIDTTWCFACGKNNPIGLKLEMHEEDGVWTAYFTPKKEHESYDDRMHGGLASTLLDEIMGDYVFRVLGKPAYTARLDVRFRSAVRIGETVKVEGRITERRGRLILTEGRILHEDGTIAAEASAKMMAAKE